MLSRLSVNERFFQLYPTPITLYRSIRIFCNICLLYHVYSCIFRCLGFHYKRGKKLQPSICWPSKFSLTFAGKNSWGLFHCAFAAFMNGIFTLSWWSFVSLLQAIGTMCTFLFYIQRKRIFHFNTVHFQKVLWKSLIRLNIVFVLVFAEVTLFQHAKSIVLE